MRGACALALVTLAACGSGRGSDPVAKDVRAGVEAQLGVAPAGIRCTKERCEVDLGSARIAVGLAGDREVAWQTDEVVLAAPLAALVGEELADLGVAAAVDCGPPVQPVPADGRMTCHVDGGGLAWLRLGDAGQVDVEVALTAEAVAARTGDADDEALERMSRALDSDEAEGEDDPDGPDDAGDGGRDAGIDAPAPRGPGG